MVGSMLLFLGLGVLLWLLAPNGTNEGVGSTLEPRVDPADEDIEPGPSWDGLDPLELDHLSRLDAGDPFQELQGFLFPPLEEPADDWWWRDSDVSAFVPAAELDSSDAADLYVNPATSLGIVAGGPAGIDTDGNASGFSSSDDFPNHGGEISLGDTGWTDDSATSFGSDDWS